MKDFDYHLKLLADLVGGFDCWDDPTTMSLKIRTHRDDVVHTISRAELMAARDENEIFQRIIDLIADKQVDASRKYIQAAPGNEKVERIKEINNELDILRGRIATPKGYTINIARAKELMIELQELMK
jgi:hypothetical protein